MNINILIDSQLQVLLRTVCANLGTAHQIGTDPQNRVLLKCGRESNIFPHKSFVIFDNEPQHFLCTNYQLRR